VSDAVRYEVDWNDENVLLSFRDEDGYGEKYLFSSDDAERFADAVLCAVYEQREELTRLFKPDW
jgi:hypothetical protein